MFSNPVWPVSVVFQAQYPPGHSKYATNLETIFAKCKKMVQNPIAGPDGHQFAHFWCPGNILDVPACLELSRQGWPVRWDEPCRAQVRASARGMRHPTYRGLWSHLSKMMAIVYNILR